MRRNLCTLHKEGWVCSFLHVHPVRLQDSYFGAVGNGIITCRCLGPTLWSYYFFLHLGYTLFLIFLLQFVYCQVCCEPFHKFCLEENERPLEDQLENWCCRRCKFCHVCGRQHQATKVEDLVEAVVELPSPPSAPGFCIVVTISADSFSVCLKITS